MANVFHILAKRFLTPAVGVMVVLVLVGTAAITVAQTGGPQITNVTVNSVTDTGAEIGFTTSALAGAKVLYGTTTAYGSATSVGYTTPEAITHRILIGNLTPSTTYHFQIEVSNSSGVTKSADRSFTTRASGGGNTGPLILSNIVNDCIDTRCQIIFTPSRPANVQIVWDTGPNSGFSAYPPGNIVSDPAGVYDASRRALAIPSSGAFNPGTVYYYRLRAQDGPVTTATIETNDLQFRTGLNANDHVFSTGGCDVNGTVIPIGSCGPGGYYCPSGGGAAVQDCTQSCGFTCPGSSTCRTNGNCEADPPLTGSPFQCNNTTAGPNNCFDDNGQILNPAPPGCYETWGKCNANTILKVQKDRGCNLWLSCATSVQTEPRQGIPAENLCLTLAACNSLNQEGQCNSYLPQGQCSNDPLRFCATQDDCLSGGSCVFSPADEPSKALQDLTYTTPAQVKQIANLSGNVIAGLDWNQISATHVIQGNLPWQLMRQAGGDSQITNGDLEANPPSPDPWTFIPRSEAKGNFAVEFEDQSNSINHVLRASFVTSLPKATPICSNAATTTCTVDSDCPAGGTCDADDPVNFSGVASKEFTAEPSEFYYAEVRIKAVSKTPKVRVQFGYDGYTCFNVPCGASNPPTYVDVVAKSAWQRVTLGPITGMSGQTQLAIVCADNATCDSASIFVDDIQVKPVLQVNTNPSFITPSCRLYPKEDSPSCDYYDQNGILYKGWKGYCLETDSITGTCLSWWPVDILRGESSIFGSETQTGYADRTPLYICAESKGVFNTPDPVNGSTVFTGNACDTDSRSTNRICGQPNLNYQAMTTKVRGFVDRNGSLDINGTDEVEDQGDCKNNTASCRGFYYLSENISGNTIVAPTGADLQLHDYDVDYFRILLYRRSERFKQISLPTQFVVAPTDPPVTENGLIVWKASWGLGQAGVCDGVEFELRWDPATHLLNSYRFNAQDCVAADTDEGFYAMGLWALKEQCTKLVQVVKPAEVAQVYANRITSNTYRVENLRYSRVNDLAPFGGVLQPGTTNTISPYDPTTWPMSLAAEAPDNSGFDENLAAPYQARSGSPYACVGNCHPVCNTQYPGPLPAKDCQSNNDCSGLTSIGGTVSPASYTTEPDLAVRGKCVGVPGGATAANKGAQQFSNAHAPTAADPVVDKAFFAQERIRRLFVHSLGSWQWDPVNQVYSSLGTSWGPPETTCPIDTTTNLPVRGAFPNDYCANPPTVIPGSAKFLNGNSTVATITGGSGSIGLKFNTDADPEQVPLKNFTIAWGDSSNTYSYPYAPKNDPTKPHIFSHVYNNTGPTCGGSQTTNCCTIQNGRKSCTYQIRIQVKDNWEWCNNGVSGDKCPATLSSANDTGLTVRVQP